MADKGGNRSCCRSWDVCYIREELIHANPADNRAASAIDDDLTAVAEAAFPAVGVAHRNEGDAGWPRGTPGEAVTHALAGTYISDAGDAGAEREDGPKVRTRGVRRQHAMQGQTDAYARVAKFFPAEGRGRIRGVEVRDPWEPVDRRAEAGVLFVGEGIVGFIGIGHVCGEAFDFDTRKLTKRFREVHRRIECEAEAVKAGIDFHVNFRSDAGTAGRFGE